MTVKQQEKNGNIEVVCSCLDIARTLDCGQAFRWVQTASGAWHGVAFGIPLTVSQEGEKIIFHNTSEEVFENIWKP